MATSKKKAGKNDDDRLMTLEELARFLHLGRKTVLKLAASSKLPGVLIDGQWRFERGKIDVWLESQQRGGEPELFDDDGPDGMKVPLGDLLPDEAVVADLRAKDALGVIEELAARAYGNRWLTDKPWFIGAVVERESLASTAMEGGVAFLHTRLRDRGKIERPFIICGRSYPGIDFGAPDGKPTHLFFLLGLKYDRLHLPILGRLARAMKDAKTIARLRSLPSTSKMRALLLKEDERARKQTTTGAVAYRRPEPQMDREQRLRAIMRRAAIRKHEAKKEEEEARKEEIKRAKAEAAAEKKRLAAEKRRAIAEKKKAAAAKKKAAAAKKREAERAKKRKAAEKKKAAAAKKRVLAAKKRDAEREKKRKAAEKKKAAAAKKKEAAAKKKEAAAKKKAAAAAKKKKAAAKKKR